VRRHRGFLDRRTFALAAHVTQVYRFYAPPALLIH
jgi:hypothetical protein